MANKRAHLTVVDPSTGQPLAGTVIFRTERRTRKGQFFMLDHDTQAMRDLNQKRLPATVLNALLYALTHVEKNNVLDIGIAELAEACAMTQTQASQALKRLREEGVLVAYRTSRLRMHMLNPAFGWNGAAGDMIQGFAAWTQRLEAQNLAQQQTKLRLITKPAPKQAGNRKQNQQPTAAL